MKVKIPKDLLGATYPTVLNIVLAELNIDTFLPSLFFKVMSGGKGKQRPKLSNDEKAIGMYANKLAEHELLRGFDTRDGRRVLEKFVRTTLISTSQVGRAKQGGEQITSLTPYSLLSYKPGFPASTTRHRGVDSFIYYVLRDYLRMGGSIHEAQELLIQRFIEAFGKGVDFDRTPGNPDGRYDGRTPLDTLTRMSLAYIDCFEPTKFGRESDSSKESPCPTLTQHIAQDILLFLNTYSVLMPSQALTYYFQSLIGFEMYTYSLRLAHAVNQLVRDPSKLPPVMQSKVERVEPLIYLDFVGRNRHLSQVMAIECVRRDVENFQQFFRSMLQLRWLDKEVTKLKRSPRTKSRVEHYLQDKPTGAAYLQVMLQMRDDPQLQFSFDAAAQQAITAIYNGPRNSDSD